MKVYVPPHIRERETRRKRSRFYFFLFLLCGIIAGMIYGIFLNPKLQVKQVIVFGSDKISVADLDDVVFGKKMLRVISGNNLLFLRADDFVSVIEKYPEIKHFLLKKDYKNSSLYFDIQTRVPEGVWCYGGEKCLLFDASGMLFAEFVEGNASSSFPVILRDTSPLAALFVSSPAEIQNNTQKALRDTVAGPLELERIKALFAFLKEQEIPVVVAAFLDDTHRDIIFETKDGGAILINLMRDIEETKRDFVLVKDKLNPNFAYADFRISGRVYSK